MTQEPGTCPGAREVRIYISAEFSNEVPSALCAKPLAQQRRQRVGAPLNWRPGGLLPGLQHSCYTRMSLRDLLARCQPRAAASKNRIAAVPDDLLLHIFQLIPEHTCTAFKGAIVVNRCAKRAAACSAPLHSAAPARIGCSVCIHVIQPAARCPAAGGRWRLCAGAGAALPCRCPAPAWSCASSRWSTQLARLAMWIL